MRRPAVMEHLVGRASELNAFDNLLGDLHQGQARAVVLSGEPGIGKTRLLTELAARADADQLVLYGSASELERDLPYYVFVDALDEYLQALEPSRLEALDDEVRTGLAGVFPSLHRFAAEREVVMNQERYRTHRAVRELLERLTATKPLVVVLDDLHWADAASVDLLGALLHRPPDAAVLLALAARPQVPERLSAAFVRADRAGLLVRLDLDALSREDAEELLGEGFDEAAAGTLYDESGGNPFYLEQLARWTVERDHSRDDALSGLDVPPGVSAALAGELADLDETTRRVLEGAAVIGDPFDPELAAAAAAADEASALDAVDELLRRDLVRETDVPRRFRFRHPLVRHAVYEAAPPAWRLGAHERAADTLVQRGAGAAERAHHVERAGRQGDSAAIAVLREAGDAAIHRAPESAAHWFRVALQLLPEDAPADARVELMVERAAALAGCGRFADSHAVLLESMAVVPHDAVALRVRVITNCASVEHLLGRHAQAHARLETALSEVDEPDSREAIELMIELGVDSLYRAEYDEMQHWAERAVTAGGDRALTAAALALRALAAALSGSVVEARAYREEAANVVDLLSDEELAARLDALAHLATAEVYLDYFEASGRHAERAVEIGRATGQSDLFPLLFPTLGTALWVQGRIAEAAEVFDDAIEAARLIDNAQGVVWQLYNRSFAALAGGDVELALATAQESVDGAKELDESVLTGHAAWALAQAWVEIGRAEEAADLLLTTTGGEELRVIPGGWRASGLELLTRALLATGRREEAARAAAAAVACGETVGLPMAGALARLAEAAVDLDAGDAARAAERALDAVAALEEVGDAYHASRARMLAGRALAQVGDADRAASELERAATAFDSFGADRYRAEADQELRKLGRRVHRRTGAGAGDGVLGVLTERELQLARLVVDRKTNPQIAGELFLSPKTVETHLRNIFRKVGVANRVELARAVEQADRSAAR